LAPPELFHHQLEQQLQPVETACELIQVVNNMKRNSRLIDLAKRLWRDESGVLHAGDYVLMVTIVCVGAVAGLATVRDGVVQDLGDAAVALETIDQSYTVTMTFGTLQGGAIVKEFGYQDPPLDPGLEDLPGEAPHGIEICNPPSGGESAP
jgi:hypothetical protein